MPLLFNANVILTSIPFLFVYLTPVPPSDGAKIPTTTGAKGNGMGEKGERERETIIRSEVHSRSFVRNQSRCQGNARQRNSVSSRPSLTGSPAPRSSSRTPAGKRTPKLWIRVLLTTNSTPGDSGIYFHTLQQRHRGSSSTARFRM